ncbi:poly(3-hydroxyalkanoate) depolymerase [Pseudonocardia sp. 73-21]|jgi:poly(3-hydroxyalkanoate) depolymerase|uniref:poly(3-hydroxyalkanoate) depolymerase n=1 Tax=Pseudonocardia sp. 73-21 TaxID=1895809 RepID=UPI0009664074|nr:poly(3-hydroxyalkanoate) depolymerase [Pseudonocardia sp. 73-21]OJY50204.1 MAG: poly(3-hydroxyalkanoate) depolymerase [Pseudonocardia sp. 73-21]
MSTSLEDDVFETVVRGRRLRVSIRRAAGPGPARTPLLLLNGIGASLELLQPFVDELPPAIEVIRFDVPGIGGSPVPRIPYHMSTLAPLVGTMIRRLGYDKVDVMGFSWGGGLAQQFAVVQRRQTRKLVLAATGTGSLMVPARPNVLAKMLTPRRHQDPDYARTIAGEIYGGTMRSTPEAAANVLHAFTRKGPSRGYYYQLLAGAGWSSLPALGLIRQPTLIIAGDDDPIIPIVNAKIMARGIPRSRLHIYEGGHLALLTEAKDLTPVIDHFLLED